MTQQNKPQGSNFKALLDKFVGEEIGMNYKSEGELSKAKLVDATDEYFTIIDSNTSAMIHIPYSRLVLIEEHENIIRVRKRNRAISARVFIYVDYPTASEGLGFFGLVIV